jgi:hypothetical protein
MSKESLVGWDERDEVLRRRYQEALDAGMSDRDADVFSRSERDIGHLRWVVLKGCPKQLVAQIVL